MEFGVCRWMVDSVQIVLFGVACGVGTDAASQELLTFLQALRDVRRVYPGDLGVCRVGHG
jgi:hypothetical protein